MTLQILPPGQHRPASSRRTVSYLDDGCQVVWEPTRPLGRFACDAERYDRRPRAKLVERYGFSSDSFVFACEWTHAEVAAKLANVPIALWLRSRGRFAPIEAITLAHTERALVITIGMAGEMLPSELPEVLSVAHDKASTVGRAFGPATSAPRCLR